MVVPLPFAAPSENYQNVKENSEGASRKVEENPIKIDR